LKRRSYHASFLRVRVFTDAIDLRTRSDNHCDDGIAFAADAAEWERLIFSFLAYLC
jgi:hypothetical protein